MLGLTFGAALAILTGWAYVDYTENPRARWATGADLHREPQHVQDWLPGWIPEDATDILEVHNVDINTTWVRLRVPQDQLDQLRSAQPLTFAQVRENPTPPFWAGLNWPAALKQPHLITAPDNLRLYAGPDGRSCIAVFPPSDTVYTWTCNWAGR